MWPKEADAPEKKHKNEGKKKRGSKINWKKKNSVFNDNKLLETSSSCPDFYPETWRYYEGPSRIYSLGNIQPSMRESCKVPEPLNSKGWQKKILAISHFSNLSRKVPFFGKIFFQETAGHVGIYEIIRESSFSCEILW